MATTTKPPAPRATGARSSRRRRRDEVRAQIVSSALELSEQGPFRDLTVDEIARAAGLSRSAFYTHFRDKHDLLLGAVEEIAGELYRMADRWWHGEGPPAKQVRDAIQGVVSVYAEHAGVLRVATEVSTYDEEVRTVWIGIVQRFIDATAEHIYTEQAAGLIPTSLKPEVTAESLVWMVERCCYIYLGREERKPAEVVRGLAPVWTAALYPGVIPADQLRPRGRASAAARRRSGDA
jgi:TetR/AcrR family transcriptional regulator, ethionamide resistance regulator